MKKLKNFVLGKIKSNRAFTLTELIIVMAIMGILASIAVPSVQHYLAKAAVSKAEYTAAIVANAVRMAYISGEFEFGFGLDGAQQPTGPRFTTVNITAHNNKDYMQKSDRLIFSGGMQLVLPGTKTPIGDQAFNDIMYRFLSNDKNASMIDDPEADKGYAAGYFTDAANPKHALLSLQLSNKGAVKSIYPVASASAAYDKTHMVIYRKNAVAFVRPVVNLP